MRCVLRYVNLVPNAYSQEFGIWFDVHAKNWCFDTKSDVHGGKASLLGRTMVSEPVHFTLSLLVKNH